MFIRVFSMNAFPSSDPVPVTQPPMTKSKTLRSRHWFFIDTPFRLVVFNSPTLSMGTEIARQAFCYYRLKTQAEFIMQFLWDCRVAFDRINKSSTTGLNLKVGIGELPETHDDRVDNKRIEESENRLRRRQLLLAFIAVARGFRQHIGIGVNDKKTQKQADHSA